MHLNKSDSILTHSVYYACAYLLILSLAIINVIIYLLIMNGNISETVLWKTNRKYYVIYQLAALPMTLSDL